jgi:hypothetical protein
MITLKQQKSSKDLTANFFDTLIHNEGFNFHHTPLPASVICSVAYYFREQIKMRFVILSGSIYYLSKFIPPIMRGTNMCLIFAANFASYNLSGMLR